MNIFKLSEKLAKKMTWVDFAMFKGSVFFFTLFLVTAWVGFRNVVFSIDWYWHLIVGIILMIPLWKKMFS